MRTINELLEDLEVLAGHLEAAGTIGFAMSVREARTMIKQQNDILTRLHNPWDVNCSRNLHGEPTKPDARCLICSPQPEYIGKLCTIAPAVSGLVTERDHRVCYHGELWHAL